MVPHRFRAAALVEENQRIRETRLAQPGGLRDPFLDLCQIVLQDLGCDGGFEFLSILNRLAVFCRNSRRIAMPFAC